MMKIRRNEYAQVMIQKLDLKRSANCLEEGKILKYNFDHQDEPNFLFQSRKWIQDV